MKVSIVTINRNNLTGLKETYRSIVSQTFKDWEWIVVDGGSTEGDRSFIKEHADRISWWCSEPDSGVYDAQNKGIAHARGEWMIFMNSGDRFCDNKVLERVFKAEHTADVLYGDWVRVYEDGRMEEIKAPERMSVHFICRDNLCHQAIFVKGDLLRQSPYNEEYTVYADWAKWIELVLGRYVFEHLPFSVCYFSVGGLSANVTAEVEKERERMIRRETYPALMETVNAYYAIRDIHTLTAETETFVYSHKTYRRIIRTALFLCRMLKKMWGV